MFSSIIKIVTVVSFLNILLLASNLQNENNSTSFRNKITGSICYNTKDKLSCNNNPNCSWCNDAGWDNSYSCYEKIDDCDCVKQVGYDDCVKLSKCHYCNFGAYGGRYCISKDVECS